MILTLIVWQGAGLAFATGHPAIAAVLFAGSAYMAGFITGVEKCARIMRTLTGANGEHDVQ